MSAKGVHVELEDLVRLRHAASGFHLLPRQPLTSLLAGNRASRLRGRGLNFEEIRGYRPGDDSRNMDWKATARLRKPQVRVYTEERDRPALLVVDQRMGMFFGSKSRMKSVVAAEAAALAAWRVLEQDDRCGGILFSDQETRFITPKRSRVTVLHLLRELVRLNQRLEVGRAAEDDPGALNRALEHAARVATHDHLVLLVSDFNGYDAQSERWLKRIAAHNDVVALLVHDPLGRALPDVGRLTFADAGARLEVDTSVARNRERVLERFDQLVDEARQFLRRIDVPLLTLTSEQAVVDQVRAQLGGGQR